MIDRRKYLTRRPERGEYEALELGRRAVFSRPQASEPPGTQSADGDRAGHHFTFPGRSALAARGLPLLRRRTSGGTSTSRQVTPVAALFEHAWLTPNSLPTAAPVSPAARCCRMSPTAAAVSLQYAG